MTFNAVNNLHDLPATLRGSDVDAAFAQLGIPTRNISAVHATKDDMVVTAHVWTGNVVRTIDVTIPIDRAAEPLLDAVRESAADVAGESFSLVNTTRLTGTILIRFEDGIHVPLDVAHMTTAEPVVKLGPAAVPRHHVRGPLLHILTLGTTSLRLTPIRDDGSVWIQHRSALTNLDVAHQVAVDGTVASNGLSGRVLALRADGFAT